MKITHAGNLGEFGQLDFVCIVLGDELDNLL